MMNLLGTRAAHHGAPVAAAAFAIFLSTSFGLAQFRAVPDLEGNTVVLDAEGLEVAIAAADPVGTRPMDCPSEAFYVSEVQADSTELVLRDCATSQQQYTVEMQGAAE